MGNMATSLRLRYLTMQLIPKPNVKLSIFMSPENKRPYIHIEIPLALAKELLITTMVRAEYESATHSVKIFPCDPEDELIMGYVVNKMKIDGKYFISFDFPGRPYGVSHVKALYTPIARLEKNYLWVKL